MWTAAVTPFSKVGSKIYVKNLLEHVEGSLSYWRIFYSFLILQ
jgi:hypothetical protein